MFWVLQLKPIKTNYESGEGIPPSQEQYPLILHHKLHQNNVVMFPSIQSFQPQNLVHIFQFTFI